MKRALKWSGIVIGAIVGIFVLLVILVAIFAPRQSYQTPAASTASATPTPESEPLAFKGVGAKATPKFDLQVGLATFEMMHGGSPNFEVTLVGAKGEMVKLITDSILETANARQKRPLGATAVVSVQEEAVSVLASVFGGDRAKPGSHVLNITADGNWSITLRQVSLKSVPEPPQTFRGTGMGMSPPFMLKEGLVTFSFTHDGKSEFAVVLLSVPATPGGKREPLVIKSGSFEGSKAVGVKGDAGVKAGIYVLEIRADGNWTVSISR